MTIRRRQLPAQVLAKLVELDESAEFFTRKLAHIEDGIADARRRLTGGFSKQSEYDDLNASLKQMIADKPTLEEKLHTAQSVLSACKVFLNRLPPDTLLEVVTIDVNGHTLSAVRSKLEAAKAELAELRAVPIPVADIEERVRAYVESKARPQISGVGKGEQLKVVWPGAGFGPSGPREDKADPFTLMAFLHGDAMVEALMGEIERMADRPIPREERKERIAALKHEINELAFIEEALISETDDGVERSLDAPPEAVLGVRVKEKERAVA